MPIITSIVSDTCRLALVLAVLFSLEMFFGREQQSMLSRLKAWTFWLISIPASVTATWLGLVAAEHLMPRPMMVLDLDRLPFAIVLGPIVGAILGDFLFYWMHRAQHTRLLWRFHAVHHAIEELNAVSSYHHVSEGLVRALFIALPTQVVAIQLGGQALGWVIVAQGMYLHSCTRLHLGPVRYLVGDNRFHRIHHSTDPLHFNRNFSGFTPIWDVVFGTAYFPKAHEWPKTGLSDQPEVASIVDYLTRPFRSADRAEAEPRAVEA